MSPEIKKFFEKIRLDKSLQEKLYNTSEVADVADIANSLGFSLSPADILRPQAVRILMLSFEELKTAANGGKPQYGLQWGRGGNGYLNRPGHWILKIQTWGLPLQPLLLKDDAKIMELVKKAENNEDLKMKIINAANFTELYNIAQEEGCDISLTSLMYYLAKSILMLGDDCANKVASGQLD